MHLSPRVQESEERQAGGHGTPGGYDDPVPEGWPLLEQHP